MTTDRKNFESHEIRAIIVTVKYPGVVQLVARDIWESEEQDKTFNSEKPANGCAATGSWIGYFPQGLFFRAFDHLRTHS